jgi:hypothetical protein
VSVPNPNQQRALEAILARASKDRAFREQLLRDPRTAIQSAFGMQIPPDFRIKFVERDADVDALIVLPDLREGGDDEEDGALSEDELETVSGGGGAHQTWSRTAKLPRVRSTHHF